MVSYDRLGIHPWGFVDYRVQTDCADPLAFLASLPRISRAGWDHILRSWLVVGGRPQVRSTFNSGRAQPLQPSMASPASIVPPAAPPPPRKVSYITSAELTAVSDLLPSNLSRASRVHSLVSAFGLLQVGEDDGVAIGEALGSKGERNRAKVVEPEKATQGMLTRYHDKGFIS